MRNTNHSELAKTVIIGLKIVLLGVQLLIHITTPNELIICQLFHINVSTKSMCIVVREASNVCQWIFLRKKNECGCLQATISETATWVFAEKTTPTRHSGALSCASGVNGENKNILANSQSISNILHFDSTQQ